MNPLLVALDFPSATEAVRMAIRLVDVVGGFKIGLQLLSGPGPGTVLAIRELGKPVFVDAKLHDIPNTVEAAARRLGALGARWVTVHASGGEVMMAAAVNGLASGADEGPAGILAVTVLTSLDTSSLARTGVTGSPGRQVSRLSRLAGEAGAEGVVCSVRELGDVAQVAAGLLRVTPGIRPAGANFDDQSRVSTPSEAIRRGADYVVVGRPITRAADPLVAAAAISEEITSARI